MANVENPNERVLGANNLIVTSYIEDSAIYFKNFKAINYAGSVALYTITESKILYNDKNKTTLHISFGGVNEKNLELGNEEYITIEPVPSVGTAENPLSQYAIQISTPKNSNPGIIGDEDGNTTIVISDIIPAGIDYISIKYI